ncbi:MAG: helix-turn-helix domain-containing protein [Actinomycetes bacterium]
MTVTNLHQPEPPHSARLDPMPRALYTADEVADALCISETLVRQLTIDGEIPCRRIGRLVRYTPSDVAFFVARREDHGYR